MLGFDDTIYAPATPIAKSGVAVIRISGPNCMNVAEHFGFKHKMEHGKACFHRLYCADGSLLDEGIVLFFASPSSFTGEDTIELQLHGSVAVVKRALDELSSIENLRYAEPGEFAKRAFLNDKINLCQAEGLAALIDAETEMQRSVAIRQSTQQQNHQAYNLWRQTLVLALSHLEAFIDFPAEDLPMDALAAVDEKITQFFYILEEHLTVNATARVLRRGIKVAILGAANAGKSSLLNALAKRDMAIVSHRAGTTRDIIELSLDVGGFLFHISDTAGLRDTDDEIEQEGIRRSLRAFDEADLCVVMVDTSNPDFADVLLEQMKQSFKPYILIYNKVDLLEQQITLTIPSKIADYDPEALLNISCHQEQLARRQVMNVLQEFAQSKYTISPECILASERDLALIQEMLNHVQVYLLSTDVSMEVRCHHLRMALSCLGRIVGKIDIEEVLDSVFGSFCIGK